MLQHNNFWCDPWWEFHQHDDIHISKLVIPKLHSLKQEGLSPAQSVVIVTPYSVICDHKLSSWQLFSSNIWHLIYLLIMSIKPSTTASPAVYILFLMQQPCRQTLSWNGYPPHIMPYSFILLYLLQTSLFIISNYLSTAVDLAGYITLLMQQPCTQTLKWNWYLPDPKLY